MIIKSATKVMLAVGVWLGLLFRSVPVSAECNFKVNIWKDTSVANHPLCDEVYVTLDATNNDHKSATVDFNSDGFASHVFTHNGDFTGKCDSGSWQQLRISNPCDTNVVITDIEMGHTTAKKYSYFAEAGTQGGASSCLEDKKIVLGETLYRSIQLNPAKTVGITVLSSVPPTPIAGVSCGF